MTQAEPGTVREHRQREEFRLAVRALLMNPLMGPDHDAFPAVRRQAERVRDWFAREAGWPLQVEREGARLYKRPADPDDPTRGLRDYDRRRYALLCLACAVLERSDPQITLHVLGERLLTQAAEPGLAALGFSFTLATASERRDLVTICRTLLEFGVLSRVAGDEEGFVQGGGSQADALYDVQRRPLAGMLAAVRGPSTWRPEDAPAAPTARCLALITEHMPDSDESRRTAIRHRLARRLLDDPVIYVDSLDTEAAGYFSNQRGAMAARLCEATGLIAEHRAEGLALTDETGGLTDVQMPAEGTEAHATLLLAELLAGRMRDPQGSSSLPVTLDAAAAFLRDARERYGRYWRKSAREAGSEYELVETAVDRLEKLLLVRRDGVLLHPRPALARFALAEAEIRKRSAPDGETGSLF
jgi:uncharacterized protein (TIGR02678 family)